MRLFVAVNFCDETRSRLVVLRDDLQSKVKRGNFTAAENLHLTLAFLGECDGVQMAEAKAVIDAIIFEPFAITIDSVGRFRRDRGDLWWAGVQESRELSSLHLHLTDRLAAAGFTIEKRKFNPHITLGREIITTARPWKNEPFGEEVSSIELMKSERIDGVLTYTALH